MTGAASGYLLRRIPKVAGGYPGRGCSRAELAAALHVRVSDRMLDRMIWAVYRRGEIDLCAGYIVAPPRKSQERAPS